MALSQKSIRASVVFMLRTAAEAMLEQLASTDASCARPALQLGFETSRYSKSLPQWERLYAEAVEAREPQAQAEYEAQRAEYRAKVRAQMRLIWADIQANGARQLRYAAGSTHLPEDLRGWVRRQLARSQQAGNASPWSLAYVVLCVRDALDWEYSHLPFRSAEGPLDQLQAEWVERNSADDSTYDGSGLRFDDEEKAEFVAYNDPDPRVERVTLSVPQVVAIRRYYEAAKAGTLPPNKAALLAQLASQRLLQHDAGALHLASDVRIPVEAVVAMLRRIRSAALVAA